MQPALRKRGMCAASAPVVDSAELIREGSAGCDGCSEAISAQTNHNGGPQRLIGLSMGAPPADGGTYQFILGSFVTGWSQIERKSVHVPIVSTPSINAKLTRHCRKGPGPGMLRC